MAINRGRFLGSFQEPDKFEGVRGFAENLIGGMIQQDERKRAGKQITDFARDLGIRLDKTTTPTSPAAIDLISKALLPALSDRIQGQFDPFGQQAASADLTRARTAGLSIPKPTETQKLRQEGYGPEEIKRIRDIKHGIKPRASSTKTYESMSPTEKAKYLATERAKAEGQYFGIEGGNPVARQPEYLEWILKEQKKVNAILNPTSKKLTRQAGEIITPTTQAEFDAIPSGTIFIDDDGKKKRKR